MTHGSTDYFAQLAGRALFLWAMTGLAAPSGLGAQVNAAPAPAVIVSQAEWMAVMSQSAANNTLDTRVAETPVRGGVVRAGVIYRSRPETRALVHQELTEIYSIVDGSGTLVTGGTATDSQPVSDPPNLGLTPSFFVTQVGGDVRRVGPGDIVIIPAGLPHRLIELDGPMSYTIYRFEPTQPR